MARSLVEKRPQAIRDLSDIAVYLAEESGSDDLAFRFLEAAEAAFKQLVAMPAMGVVREYRDPALADVRMWRIAGFDNHLIFYRSAESGIHTGDMGNTLASKGFWTLSRRPVSWSKNPDHIA